MTNSSAGYHTFSLYQKLTSDEYQELNSDFLFYWNRNKDIINRTPMKNSKGKQTGWLYFYCKNKGIQWILNASSNDKDFSWYGVTSVINPKALLENNYITAARESDLSRVEEIYNCEAQKISKILNNFGEAPVNRADYCINIDLKELGLPCTPEQMMHLIRQGNIPKNFQERLVYNKEQHRFTSEPDCLYLKNKQVHVNYYWKYAQLHDEDHPTFSSREEYRNVIRFEIQYKHNKLYRLLKDKKQDSKFYFPENHEDYFTMWYYGFRNPSIPVDIALTSNISTAVNKKYFYKIVGSGDYFTMKLAKQIVESYQFRTEREERLLFTLEMVKKYRGISKAKSELRGPDLDDFKTSIKDLNAIGINPVTIPKRWNIDHIPNLFRTFEETLYEEELIPQQEYTARQHIETILFS